MSICTLLIMAQLKAQGYMSYREIDAGAEVAHIRRELAALKTSQQAELPAIYMYRYNGTWSSTGSEVKYVVFRQNNPVLPASVQITLDLPNSKVIGSAEMTAPDGVWAVDVGRLPASSYKWQVVSTVKGTATVETSFPM